MRYEAKHQAIKRKCKSMGFKNVNETVPKLMNESRQSELKKLEKIQTRENQFRRGFYFFGHVGTTTGIYKTISSKTKFITLQKVEAKFDEKLLAYMVLKENNSVDININSIQVISNGLQTQYNSQQYVFFFDYLN